MTKRNWPWSPPRTREGRNKQRDLLGGLFNAVAIALLVTAVAGPEINPALTNLSWMERIRFAFFAVLVHLFARRLVRDMEDRS
jgi:hypothetical protein